MSLPTAATPKDVRLQVFPRRFSLAVRGASILEGALGGEVLSDAGDVEWELSKDGRLLSLVLPKREVFYEPDKQWRCFMDGHPQIDTSKLSWQRDRPWRPARVANTLADVAKALPGNAVLAEPSNLMRATDDGSSKAWGDGWNKRKM